MFDVDFSELAVVGIVALLVVGPKDLPRLMRTVGHWMGRARGMARHVRSGFDTMVREAEIEELNRRWEQQNRDIIAATRTDTWMDASDSDAGPSPAKTTEPPAEWREVQPAQPGIIMTPINQTPAPPRGAAENPAPPAKDPPPGQLA